MNNLYQSTATNVLVFMTDSADRSLGKTGLTLTITASKDGGVFNSISPTVTERGDGFYSIALTTSHTDTLGDLGLKITGTGADMTGRIFRVVVVPSEKTVTDAIKIKTDTIPSWPANFSTLVIDGSGFVTYSNTAPPSAATISTQVVSDLGTAHGAGSWETATGFSTLDANGVRTAVGLASANMDTQFNNINSKTANLPSDPADHSDIIAATNAIMSRLGAPAGVSMSADILALKNDTTAILLDTGTDGVVLSSATQVSIADTLLKRNMSSVEDTAGLDSVCAIVLALLHGVRTSSTVFKIYKTDDTTEFDTKTIETDGTLLPVKKVSG